MHALHTQVSCPCHIGFHVVHKNGAFGSDSERLQGIAKNQGRWFACTDNAGIGSGRLREKTEKIKCRFKMSDMNWICVGKQSKAKILSQRFEKRIVLDWRGI